MWNHQKMDEETLGEENNERSMDLHVQTVTEKCKMSMIAMPKFRFYQEEVQPKGASTGKCVVFLILIVVLILAGLCSVIAGIIISEKQTTGNVWKVHTLHLNTTETGRVEEQIHLDTTDEIVKYTISEGQFTAIYDYSRGLIVIKTEPLARMHDKLGRCFLATEDPTLDSSEPFSSEALDAFLQKTKMLNVRGSRTSVRNYTVSHKPISETGFLQEPLRNSCDNLDTLWLIPTSVHEGTNIGLHEPQNLDKRELVRGCVWTARVKHAQISMEKDCYIISSDL
ncbi:uncharacterized protein LOC106180026 [Lingula anatina]|uniref:Uncharacterized protein LOC106180026 n=1 Tax=Lingula anatina TaxID=7574 RepID=A0A1S3K9N9_LINAN|nr:uncharacterized protein LOC106180026 [Lingula anatina]|eukprot:XP_013419345.1 uncharacterized protein LOC106180026 [Lingula anatina]